MTTVGLWLRGGLAAAIGGASNALAVFFVDPDHFNFGPGARALVKVAGLGALISLLAYLKRSPLPGLAAPPEPEDYPRLHVGPP